MATRALRTPTMLDECTTMGMDALRCDFRMRVGWGAPWAAARGKN